MVHPALLRASSSPVRPSVVRPPAHGAGRGLLEMAKRLVRRVNGRVASGYRPEQHYMRGGRTEGAKSLAAG